MSHCIERNAFNSKHNGVRGGHFLGFVDFGHDFASSKQQTVSSVLSKYYFICEEEKERQRQRGLKKEKREIEQDRVQQK